VKKQKPIKISRREVRKSIRKPMPPPAKVFPDRKKAKLAKQLDREQRQLDS
jgi:hypothetical protein